MFSRMPNARALRRMLTDLSGSRKYKLADVKLEIHVSQLVNKAESNFQMQLPDEISVSPWLLMRMMMMMIFNVFIFLAVLCPRSIKIGTLFALDQNIDLDYVALLY